MRTKRLNITLDREIADTLSEIARETKEKKSHIIEKALLFYFDYLDITIAEERIEKLKKGKTKLIPAEKIYKELGI